MDDDGVGFDAVDAGGSATAADDDDNDDGGGVDFGMSVADDASQSQLITSQMMDDLACDGSVLTGDNLLAVPRKVRTSTHQWQYLQSV